MARVYCKRRATAAHNTGKLVGSVGGVIGTGVGVAFDNVHSAANKKENHEFYAALRRLFDLVAPDCLG